MDQRGPNADEFLLKVQQATAGWPWYQKDPSVVRITAVWAFFRRGFNHISGTDEAGGRQILCTCRVYQV